MATKNRLIRLIEKHPYVKELLEQNEALSREKSNFDKNCWYPPGHYYSTIICVEDIRKKESEIWAPEKIDGVAGIKLNVDAQLELVEALTRYYDELPFPAEKQDKLRYYYENDWYPYSDAILLYGMIRHLRPKKI